MELFSAEYFSALLAIILIDLVLAGDNAIIIGMAARNVPQHMQKKVIFIGTFGAIAIRATATILVVSLLKIPGLLLVGGVLLLWIAYSMLVENKEHEIEAKDSFFAAVRTIIVADALMGLDNVIAVAGAAHESYSLVIIGLLISIPIIIWGSTLFIKLINRFPIIIYIGSAVIALTAGKMIFKEKFLEPFFHDHPLLKWTLIVLMIAVVTTAGWLRNKYKEQKRMEKKQQQHPVTENQGS